MSELIVYQLCYDSIWTLAGALNKTLHGKIVQWVDLHHNEKFSEVEKSDLTQQLKLH